jgi:hypothetical protein
MTQIATISPLSDLISHPVGASLLNHSCPLSWKGNWVVVALLLKKGKEEGGWQSNGDKRPFSLEWFFCCLNFNNPDRFQFIIRSIMTCLFAYGWNCCRFLSLDSYYVPPNLLHILCDPALFPSNINKEWTESQ